MSCRSGKLALLTPKHRTYTGRTQDVQNKSWTSSERPGVPCSKPLGDSKVDSTFHLSEVDNNEYQEFLGT